METVAAVTSPPIGAARRSPQGGERLGTLRRRSLDTLDALARLARRCRKGVLAMLPRRRDHAHAEDFLRRAQVVHAAPDGPPTVAGGLEKTEPRSPFLVLEGRHIAVESTAGHIEAQQREPVFQSVQGDEAAVPGRRLAVPEIALGAEQTEWIEARNDNLSLGAHGAIDLPQE